jgi:cell division protein FtsL
MSTAAAKTFPVVPGTSATDANVPAGAAGAARKARTPLSLVRTAPRKRRAPFVVLCFAMLAVALVTVLVLNISVSTAQYELVTLKARQSTLTKQNQDLTQQVQNFEAPQNLAAKATELGMVASTVKGQIDLSNLSVTGKAVPAVEGGAAGAVIPAPAVPGQLIVVPPATRGEPLAGRKTPPTTSTPTPAPAKKKVAAAPKKPAVELYGGTIPVPEQKTPEQ